MKDADIAKLSDQEILTKIEELENERAKLYELKPQGLRELYALGDLAGVVAGIGTCVSLTLVGLFLLKGDLGYLVAVAVAILVIVCIEIGLALKERSDRKHIDECCGGGLIEWEEKHRVRINELDNDLRLLRSERNWRKVRPHTIRERDPDFAINGVAEALRCPSCNAAIEVEGYDPQTSTIQCSYCGSTVTLAASL